jgi:adenosylcobinamide kinase / adenosylcobinamide-phosphate guanylyltransferase
MSIILVGGGARSGKSTHALTLARERGTRLGFLATAQALDHEMRDRIGRHQAERGGEFLTIEEPVDLAGAIERHAPALDALVVDCVTLWLSNCLLSSREADVDGVIAAAAASSAACIFVTNEVGCGIVPENALARTFRDLAGAANRRLAESAAEVYWMVFGITIKIK